MSKPKVRNPYRRHRQVVKVSTLLSPKALFSTWWGKLAGIVLLVLVLTGLTGFTAAQFENRNSFCASCHSEPESTFYQRSLAAPVDLSSFHTSKQVRCIDCHSGKGLPGRISGLTLGATDLIAFVTKNYKSPAPLTRPIRDDQCLKCHQATIQKQDFNNHFHIFLARWQAADPKAATCVSCHQGHNTDSDQTIAYLNQTVTAQVCENCHAVSGEGN